MLDKIGIIIKNVESPQISSNEMKSILSHFNTKSLDTIICEDLIEAKNIIKEKFEEISFIYLVNPIPTINKVLYDFIDFINKNEDYKHIEFFARMPKKQKENKYNWYDDFINYIKF